MEKKREKIWSIQLIRTDGDGITFVFHKNKDKKEITFELSDLDEMKYKDMRDLMQIFVAWNSGVSDIPFYYDMMFKMLKEIQKRIGA